MSRQESQKTILVTGGAGYIGAHTCKYLSRKGLTPVVLDDLSSGNRDFVKWGPLVEGDFSDQALLQKTIKQYNIQAVIHFAAFTAVGESVEDPLKYYDNNVAKTLSLLKVLQKENVQNIVFSSSAAVYGDAKEMPIQESAEKHPLNPYGYSKYMVENILSDLSVAKKMKSVCLRYFNAAGADPEGEIGESREVETHLIPIILNVVGGQRPELIIFGDTYDTPDGTCIRDYIHVTDLASAHYLALNKLLNESTTEMTASVYNVGTGKGYSVKEVVDVVENKTGKSVTTVIGEKRLGDGPILIADPSLLTSELTWEPKHSSLEDIISNAWAWHQHYHL